MFIHSTCHTHKYICEHADDHKCNKKFVMLYCGSDR